MKKNEKTVVFNKSSILELNNEQLHSVSGGTFSNSFSGPLCDWIIDRYTNP